MRFVYNEYTKPVQVQKNVNFSRMIMVNDMKGKFLNAKLFVTLLRMLGIV